MLHHTQVGYCMLTSWLSSDLNKLPNYASHFLGMCSLSHITMEALLLTCYVGVGGVVLNDKNQILTVTEKYLEKVFPGFYKVPGGAVDPGMYTGKGTVTQHGSKRACTNVRVYPPSPLYVVGVR